MCSRYRTIVSDTKEYNVSAVFLFSIPLKLNSVVVVEKSRFNQGIAPDSAQGR